FLDEECGKTINSGVCKKRGVFCFLWLYLSLVEKYEERGKIIKWFSQPSLHSQTATFYRLSELAKGWLRSLLQVFGIIQCEILKDAQNSVVTIGTSSKKSHSSSLIEFGFNKKISLQCLIFVLQNIPMSSLFGKISREDQMQTLL
ncbi:hypothetical protein NL676_029553, partial [Syzygium grande]